MGSQNPPRSNLALFFQFSDLVKVQIWLQLCQRMKKIYVQAKGIKAKSNNFCNNSRNKLHLQYVAFSILHLRAYWESSCCEPCANKTTFNINAHKQGFPTSLGYVKCNIIKLRKVSEQSELRLQNIDPIKRGEFRILTQQKGVHFEVWLV